MQNIKIYKHLKQFKKRDKLDTYTNQQQQFKSVSIETEIKGRHLQSADPVKLLIREINLNCIVIAKTYTNIEKDSFMCFV